MSKHKRLRKYIYKMCFSPYQTGLFATSIKDAKKQILEQYKGSEEKHIEYINLN